MEHICGHYDIVGLGFEILDDWILLDVQSFEVDFLVLLEDFFGSGKERG